MTAETVRSLIHVQGIVQGVGFRPFIYRLALQAGLVGTVCNTSGCVEIDVEGRRDKVRGFIEEIKNQAPPAACIDRITVEEQDPAGAAGFRILSSRPQPEEYQPLSPDLATCDACAAEIFDPSDRRYHYAFTNCTNCGPRFTIIKDIPYDRHLTTMNDFAMCPACRCEYGDPRERRFHAQPNACPACGPQLELADSNGGRIDCAGPLVEAACLLKAGKVVAIKGLGGFLLACDATCDEVVDRLRRRKRRPAKPFAVMVRGIEQAKELCRISSSEEELLLSPASPIVLLERRPADGLAFGVAPGLKYLGLMLPYTPLHHLLLAETGLPLVMTSGNLSEEPIISDNARALSRLNGIADYFLMHNRDIYASYDDSVTMQADGVTRVLRRARGYAPSPIKLGFTSLPILAVGAEMKSAFCLTRDDRAFVSQHLGDMENAETLSHYEKTLAIYKQLFRIEPRVIACDLHPDYMTTLYARETAAGDPQLHLVGVQHHHAHIASVLAENRVADPVIGVAFDGAGFGTDGAIWGGEFLLAGLGKFERLAHLEYVPLAGGDAAVRNPYRTALSYLYHLLGQQGLDEKLPPVRDTAEKEMVLLMQQVDRRLNAPLTSSCGRLFDAVAALLGIRRSISYEAQAAVELEMAASGAPCVDNAYPFEIMEQDSPCIIRLGRLLSAILDDVHDGVDRSEVACRFHLSVASMIARVCALLAARTGIRTVALSGGVFQNRLLLHLALQELERRGLAVLTNRQVPANDGGIALGQAVVAHFNMS